MQTNISFPGLGIDQFSVNKIAFSIGSISVRWYAIMITTGIILAFLYAGWRGKRNENMIFDDVIDIGLFTVILGVVGARAYYVLTTIGTGEYDYSSFIKIIAVWEGGLAIYGGIIGGCLGIVIACLIKKKKWQRAFDMIAPGVMLAQAIGRWGNFFNGEAYGYPIAETTKYYFFNTEFAPASGEGTLFNALRMGVSHNTGRIYHCYHPTFFYECVWNLLGFALINLFYKHKKFDGQIALMYFTWYGFGRMFIEGFRTDSLYLPGTTIRISQGLGLVCFVVGLTLLIVLTVLARKRGSLELAADGVRAEELPAVSDGDACNVEEPVETEASVETEEQTDPPSDPDDKEETDAEAEETVFSEESGEAATETEPENAEETENNEDGKAD